MGIKQIIALTALTASVSMLGINTTANAEEITHNNITEVILILELLEYLK